MLRCIRFLLTGIVFCAGSSLQGQDAPKNQAPSPLRKEIEFDSYEIMFDMKNLERFYGYHARIEFFQKNKKVGVADFAPGGHDMEKIVVLNDGRIELSYPWPVYASIIDLLRHEKPVVLFVEFDPTKPGDKPVIKRGGLATKKLVAPK